MWFYLTFHPTVARPAPDADQLRAELDAYPCGGGSLCTLETGQKTTTVGLLREHDHSLELILHLLRDLERRAELRTVEQLVLVQKDRELHLLQGTFWSADDRRRVAAHRSYRWGELLCQWPVQGFFSERHPDERWEAALCEALRYRPEYQPEDAIGISLQDPAVRDRLREITHLELPILGDPQIFTWNDLHEFVKRAAPDVHLQAPVAPAIVIGGLPQLTIRRPWTQFFWHQYGGSVCVPRDFSGMVLPLRLNRERGSVAADHVIAGFDALGKTPHSTSCAVTIQNSRSSKAPGRSRSVANSWTNCTASWLQVFRFQKFAQGWDALLEFEPCDLLHWFGGWRISWVEEDAGYEDIYTPEKHAQLETDFGPNLRAYLLWYNSD